MRIATWNVNSIRTRVEQVVQWAERNEIDVLLLQETKCRDEDFPREPFARIGHQVAHHGVDHWNGVAITSRLGLDDIRAGFRDPATPPFDEPRLLSATVNGVDVSSIYAPNGRALDDPHYLFKLVWLERLRGDLAARRVHRVPTVVGGDFNVAPTDADIYDPVRWRRRTHASEPERAAIRALLDLGLDDLLRARRPEPDLFTWWGYRPGQFERNRGLRIDLLLTSPSVSARAVDIRVDPAARALDRPSDHAPVVLDL